MFSAVLILFYYGLSNVSHGLPMALKLFWYGVGVINKRRENKQQVPRPAAAPKVKHKFETEKLTPSRGQAISQRGGEGMITNLAATGTPGSANPRTVYRLI